MRTRAKEIRTTRGVPTLRSAGYRTSDSARERPRLLRAGLIRERPRPPTGIGRGPTVGRGLPDYGGGGDYGGDSFDHLYDGDNYTGVAGGIIDYLNQLSDAIEYLNRPEDRDFYDHIQTGLDAIDAQYNHTYDPAQFDGVTYQYLMSELYNEWTEDPYWYDPGQDAEDNSDSVWKYHLGD